MINHFYWVCMGREEEVSLL